MPLRSRYSMIPLNVSGMRGAVAGAIGDLRLKNPGMEKSMRSE